MHLPNSNTLLHTAFEVCGLFPRRYLFPVHSVIWTGLGIFWGMQRKMREFETRRNDKDDILMEGGLPRLGGLRVTQYPFPLWVVFSSTTWGSSSARLSITTTIWRKCAVIRQISSVELAVYRWLASDSFLYTSLSALCAGSFLYGEVYKSGSRDHGEFMNQ